MTTSPITADAVGAPPAPGPRNISSPASRVVTKTALNAPVTEARGCLSGTIAGWTFTSTLSPLERPTASSFTVQFIARAAAMSWGLTSVMPSRNTSLPFTLVWNASAASSAAFDAASSPSTSAVGSASA